MTDKYFAKFLRNISSELKEIKPSVVLEETILPEETTAEKIANYLSTSQKIDDSMPSKNAELIQKSTQSDIIPASPENIEAQRWNDPLVPLDQKFVTFKDMNDHYNVFLKRIQQQMSNMSGGGEVNFRYLDDVNRSTMSSSNDNFLLEYDAASKKVQFTNQIGPIDRLNFDLNHLHDEERVVGTLCWSQEDQTLNIEHPGGVTQQVGQELYAYVRNGTANTIVEGTVCMFIGAVQPDGTSRLLVGPAVSDGTFPSLYILGVATQDIEPDEDGKVTVWGKVRELDTSAFDVGNILYSDPATPGGLTNVKPTAPNNVVPVAAVLRKGTADGEIFVRPTIEQRMYYGRFSRLADQTAPAVNQGVAVIFDTTEIANGIIFNGGSDTQILVSDSGFYQFDLSVQVTASSNKGVVYFWFRKNGTDIPHSTRSTTITNGDTFNVSTAISISLAANDYVEIMWARTADGIFLDAVPATAFSPSAASVMLNVTQIQL